MPAPKYQVYVGDKPIGFFDDSGIRKIVADNTACVLWRDGAEEGPFSASQLRAMWDSGTIKPDSHYRLQAATEWKPITELWHSWFFQAPTTEKSDSESLLSQVVEEQRKTRRIVRGIAIAVGIFFLLYFLFGLKISPK